MNKAVVWMIAGVVLVLLLCAFLLNRGHRELVDARRDAEGARLALRHQTVEDAETKRDLQDRVQNLVLRNAVLASAYAESRAAAPGSSPVSASELQTSPEKVEIRQDAVPAALPASSVAPAVPTTGQPTCALSSGESAWFKVDLIELQTKEQNTLVTGTAELWAQGIDLTDRRVLGPSRFQSQASSSAALAPQAAPRWGAEVAGMCVQTGCGLGAGVLFPPLAVLGLRLEARLDAYAGPAPALVGALGVRW